jgi:T5SS/PEP-CTERM-associated repeat protein
MFQESGGILIHANPTLAGQWGILTLDYQLEATGSGGIVEQPNPFEEFYIGSEGYALTAMSVQNENGDVSINREVANGELGGSHTDSGTISVAVELDKTTVVGFSFWAYEMFGDAWGSASASGSLEFTLVPTRFLWKGDSGNEFDNPLNWISQAVPAFTDTPVFALPGSRTVSFPASALTTHHRMEAKSQSSTLLDLEQGQWRLGLLEIGAADADPEAMVISTGADVTVTDGTLRVVGQASLADDAGSMGKLTIAGGGKLAFQSRVRVLVDTPTERRTEDLEPAFRIGNVGNGTLIAQGGGQVEAFTTQLGVKRGSFGTLDASGSGTSVNASLLNVGQGGRGSLQVRQGAIVNVANLLVGTGKRSKGEVLVEGFGSQLIYQSASTLAEAGAATVRIHNQGTLRGAAEEGAALPLAIGGSPGYPGLLEVRNAELRNAGVIVNAGGKLLLTDGASWSRGTDGGNMLSANAGKAVIEGGSTVANLDALLVGIGGNVTVQGGAKLHADCAASLAFGGMLHLMGPGSTVDELDQLIIEGVLRVDEGAELRVDADGDIVVRSPGVIMGNGGIIGRKVPDPGQLDIELEAGGQISPGASPGTLTLDGDLTLHPGSSVLLEVAGALQGSSYDRLVVNGNIHYAGGEIILRFLNGYVPEADQEFAFIQSNTRDGAVPSIRVEGLETGWSYDAGFDQVTGGFRLRSLSRGVALPPTETKLSFRSHRWTSSEDSEPAWCCMELSGPPQAEVILEATTTLENSQSWREVHRLTLDASGRADVEDVEIPGSEGIPSCFLRAVVAP